ncbi:MAG TPA: RNA 2',3'-cyclic phosphodiesterase [Terracidiphilus sp.]
MRLFIAIPLKSDLRTELATVVAQLRRPSDYLRWSQPNGWHITLQFLGNTGADKLDCLTARLSEVHSAAVPVRLGKLGSFDRAGVVYVDVEVTPELAALQQRITAATAQCGFIPEDRPFHPHITLARAKGGSQFRGLPAPRTGRENPPQFSSFAAQEFLLCESFTEREGARYEVRARFALGN